MKAPTCEILQKSEILDLIYAVYAYIRRCHQTSMVGSILS